MAYNNSDKNERHISTSVVIYTILGFLILVAIVMPILQTRYVYPRFVKLLVESTENDALQLGNYMAKIVLKGYTNGKLHITSEIKTYLDITNKDHHLWKIKVFSNLGEIIYSTSEQEVGNLNKKPYFHDIVAKGKIVTKMVSKDTKSAEDQVITSDVVEIYVPIMKNSDFIGAFELYYNITIRKESMDMLIFKTNYLLYTLSCTIIIIALLSLFGFRKNLKERRRFEEKLFEMATTDKLTGICNRGRFVELLQWEIGRFFRYQKNGCVLLLDIDHFKKVNDTYGHQAGDDVLVTLARTCKDALRVSDIFARYGGEEFIVFLPETDRKRALIVAEKLRQIVESISIKNYERTIHITISIGMTLFKDIEELSLDSVIKQADDALYTAKSRGRNQVVYFQQKA